jgi:hypothetical protein
MGSPNGYNITWDMPQIFSNPSFRLNPQDKKNDNTFNRLGGFDANGNINEVGYPAIYNMFQGLTTQQALTLAQLLNGGQGSAGQMSVNLISPPIVQSQYDSVEYVLLRGANLKLNVNAMSIEILASDKSTVVATIPNSQIQLYDDGLSLVFYYNFHNFPIGSYFIKLVSGSKTYITTLNLKIVESVENINLTEITWEKMYKNNIIPSSSDIAGFGVTSITTPSTNSSTPDISLKSSELFAQDDDFYLEIQVNFSALRGGSHLPYSYIGLGYSTTSNMLNLASLMYMGWNKYFDSSSLNINSAYGATLLYTPGTANVIFIKTGNLFRITIDSTSVSQIVSSNSGYSLFLQYTGRNDLQTIQTQIIKAFKFN